MPNLPAPNLAHTPLPALNALVVDDQALSRELLAEALRPWGMQVRQAAGGEEALAELKLKPADVVFIDLMMPGMDGQALARQLRRNEQLTMASGQRRAPSVLVAYSGQLYAEQGQLVERERLRLLDQGFDDGLAKPLTPDALAKVMVHVQAKFQTKAEETLAQTATLAAPAPVPAAVAKPMALAAAYYLPQVAGPFRSALVVDDDRVSLMAAEVQVGRLVRQVTTAGRAAEAVTAFCAQPYDLVLLDLEMPDEDGYALAARLRELEAGSRHRTCLVALSGHLANAATLKACAAKGMDDCLAKPLDPTLFKTRLSLWQQEVFPAHKLRA